MAWRVKLDFSIKKVTKADCEHKKTHMVGSREPIDIFGNMPNPNFYKCDDCELVGQYGLDGKFRVTDLAASDHINKLSPANPPKEAQEQANTWLELREQLAAIEHERWSDWQKWCHKILRENLRYNDMETNLEEILERWEKQIATPYDKLSDSEKASDMEQVNRYWPLIQAHLSKATTQARIQELEDLASLPNVYPEKINKLYTHVEAIYKSEILNRIADLRAKIEGGKDGTS